MPQAEKHALPTHKPVSIEGTTLPCSTDQARQLALQTAFDYRGDVTLELAQGKKVVGFVYRYDEKPGTVFLYLPQGKESVPETLPAQQVVAVHFTGIDPAFGKSWDDWTTKAEKERVKEAERFARESVARGEL